VERELFAVLARHVPDGIEIRTSSTITGDLCLDSLAVMEVIADVEDRFRLKIPDQELPEMRTVSDVLGALFAHLSTRGMLS
jgi:acyl carrier protein